MKYLKDGVTEAYGQARLSSCVTQRTGFVGISFEPHSNSLMMRQVCVAASLFGGQFTPGRALPPSLFVGRTLALMRQAWDESRPSFYTVDSDIVFMCRPNLSQAEQLA